jgi:hypothetical protein
MISDIIRKRHYYNLSLLLTSTVYDWYLTTVVGIEYGTFHSVSLDPLLHSLTWVCLLFGLSLSLALFFTSSSSSEAAAATTAFTRFLLHWAMARADACTYGNVYLHWYSISPFFSFPFLCYYKKWDVHVHITFDWFYRSHLVPPYSLLRIEMKGSLWTAKISKAAMYTYAHARAHK